MRSRILLAICVLLFSSCATGLKKLEYTLPVHVGGPWQSHKTEMGTPDRSGSNFYTFFDKGVIVYVDIRQELVTALVCSWFEGGKHFTGKIYGVGLGDTFPKFVNLWGEPTERKDKHYDYYVSIWKFKKFFAEVEFWAHDGHDEDLGGKYETDTAKRIKISL